MATADTLIDRTFDKRYVIKRKLGSGGMADVYLAEDQELGRRVALKLLNERHAADEQFVERFRREAQSAAGLNHPNIVSIFDRGLAEGTYYIAMEYLDGRTLKELLVRNGPTPIPIAVDYARQILGALAFAHRNGIVHRDIKPHNIVVGRDGRLKVTDFGIARSGASQMTEAGSIVGTAQYLSPEQARGAPVDPRSDLYSLGIVLYEMLTGKVPFTGDTPVEIAMKHLSQVPSPPSKLRPQVPHDLDAVVMRAIAKDPERRYGSAEEMEADLARVARGVAVSRETEDAMTQVLAGAARLPAPAAVLRLRGARSAPLVLALAARARIDRARRDRRLAALHADPAPARQQRTGLGARRTARGATARGAKNPAGRLQAPGRARAERQRREGRGHLPEPRSGDEGRQGIDGDAHGVLGHPDDDGARREGAEAHRRPAAPLCERPAAAHRVRLLRAAVGRRRRAGAGGEVQRAAEVERAHQRLEGSAARDGAERDGCAVRERRVRAAGAGLRRLARRRPVAAAEGAGRLLRPAAGHERGEGVEGRAVGVEGAGHDAGARRDAGRPADGHLAPAQRRLRGRGRVPAGERPEPGRRGHLAGSGRRPARHLRRDGDHHRRPARAGDARRRQRQRERQRSRRRRHDDLDDADAHASGPVRRRIAVVLGGRSSEHDISVASAQSVVEALADAGHDVVTVAIDRQGGWMLGSGREALEPGSSLRDEPGSGSLERLPGREVATTLADVEVVFPVLHGPFGEDGTVQGLLELAGVPYVGAGVL